MFSFKIKSDFVLVFFFAELASSKVDPLPTPSIQKGNLTKVVSDSAKNNNNNETPRNQLEQVRPLFVQIADSFATPFVNARERKNARF